MSVPHRLTRCHAHPSTLLAVTELAPYYADPGFILGLVRDWRGEGDSLAAYRAFLARARRDDPRRARVEGIVAPPPAAP